MADFTRKSADAKRGREAVRAFTITSSDIRRCPQRRFDPAHYRSDGSCECTKLQGRPSRRRRGHGRCADCGKIGELTGHQDCQFPQNH